MSLAQTIVKRLGGDWHSRYGLCSGPGHSKHDRSLKIAPHGSDPNDVFLYSFSGDDVFALKAEWREQGLLPRRGRSSHVIDPPKIAKDRQKRKADDADAAVKRQDVALWLHDQCRPARGTIVEKYLHSRDIEIEPLPPGIGYLPAHPPKYPYPAMIVPFGLPEEPEPGIYRMPRDRIQGVHLTYLKPDGSGKADIDPPRRIIGKALGSPLALMPPNDGLGLLTAEGIETALSGYILFEEGVGCWAAGSAGFLPALADAVPAFIETVTIATEADPAGRRGAEELARRLNVRGKL